MIFEERKQTCEECCVCNTDCSIEVNVNFAFSKNEDFCFGNCDCKRQGRLVKIYNINDSNCSNCVSCFKNMN